MRRFVYCPKCWRAAPSAHDLTAMGCEGEHRQAIDAEDIGPLIDALRYIRGDDVAGMEGHLPAKQVAEAALQPFEEGK